MGRKAGEKKPRRPQEVSTTEACRILEMGSDTVRTWAKEAISGGASRVNYARRDVVGRYWFDRDEIQSIKKKPHNDNT